MWTKHWKLDFNPFSARPATFVPLPSRTEGLARLIHAIESAERTISLVAESGQGKSILVREALTRVRHPLRRLVRIEQDA